MVNNSAVRKLLIGLCVLTGFLTGLAYAFSLSLKYQHQSFETEARNTAAIVRSALDVVDGVATSLRALQGSKADMERSNSYAKTVIGNYSFVSGFGRFEKIAADGTSADKPQGHSIDSSVANSIWWFDEQGNRVTTGVNTTLGVVQPGVKSRYPVTLFRTQELKQADGAEQTTTNTRVNSLQGFELASVEAMRTAIQKAGDSGRTVFVRAPRHWPAPNSVLAIRSSYQGHELPAVFKERREKADGGYWLELNIDGLAKLDGLLNDMGLKLSISEDVSEFSFGSVDDTLYSRAAQQTGYLLADWFKSNEWLNTFSVGDQTFTISLSRERGLTAVSLLTSIAGTLLVLTLLCVVAYLNGKRRNAIKKQQQQSERLYQEQHRAAVTLSSIGDAVLTIDVDKRVQYSNAAAEILLDTCADKIIGVPVVHVVRLVADGNSEEQINPLSVIGDDPAKEIASSDQILARLDGYSMAVNLTVSPLLDIRGRRNGSVIVLRDISAEKELTTKLEHQVNHDTLTGLANRFQFEKSLERLFEDPQKGANHALCIIDLDRFKQINDTCGHAAGDQLLIQLAEALQKKIRAEDLLARLGGDEFGVIIKNCDKNSANSVAQRVHRFFKSYHFEYDDQVFPVRCSIGLVHFRPATSVMDSVVSAADAACYVAKKNGRNSVHTQSVDDAVNTESLVEQKWMPRIKDALDNNRFVLYSQPIYPSGAGVNERAQHHELLVRMVGRDGSLTYPAEFLKPAERYELMTNIDRWVIDEALRMISKLPDSMDDDLFSLNLSAASVKDESLPEFIRHSLRGTGVKGQQLCFEIDEDVFLNNLESANNLFRQLRKLGCCFALDDFGAGVSSFAALKGVPVKFIKIDGQFVTSMDSSAADAGMVRSIHALARSMGLVSIAEKVESRAALALLESIEVDFLQGFAIAAPVPFDDYLTGERIAA